MCIYIYMYIYMYIWMVGTYPGYPPSLRQPWQPLRWEVNVFSHHIHRVVGNFPLAGESPWKSSGNQTWQWRILLRWWEIQPQSINVYLHGWFSTGTLDFQRVSHHVQGARWCFWRRKMLSWPLRWLGFCIQHLKMGSYPPFWQLDPANNRLMIYAS